MAVKINNFEIINDGLQLVINVETADLFTISSILLWDINTFKNYAKAINLDYKLDGGSNIESFIVNASELEIAKFEDIYFIEIKDNAEGIKEEIIGRIFEPYFTTKHQSQGTGMGLYMSQNIVKNYLNGTLDVYNEDYKYKGLAYTGAKFIIII